MIMAVVLQAQVTSKVTENVAKKVKNDLKTATDITNKQLNEIHHLVNGRLKTALAEISRLTEELRKLNDGK